MSLFDELIFLIGIRIIDISNCLVHGSAVLKSKQEIGGTTAKL